MPLVHITKLQAILIGLWAGLVHIGPGYTTFIAMQPLITGFVVGLILGHPAEALMISVPIQLIYMGVIAPGGNTPTDASVAAIIGVSTALSTGITPEEAVVLAVPVGLVANYLTSIRYLINTVWIHNADRAAEKGDIRAIGLNASAFPVITNVLLYLIPVAVAVYVSPALMSSLLKAIPQNVMHAFNVVGGVLPALGFALTLFVIGRRDLLVFFVAAFYIAEILKPLNVNTLVYAILGGILAYVYVTLKPASQKIGGDLNVTNK